MWNDPIYGKPFKIISKIFFGGTFPHDYIINSKIKEEYKDKHLEAIKNFEKLVWNPKWFPELSILKN